MGTIDFTDSIYDAQQGSQSAVKFIYDNTIQSFNKEAAVFMKSAEEADAAVRDAYLFIFDHLNTLEDTSKFLLWASEVCKNTCIAKLKKDNAFRERIPAEAANLGEVLSAEDFDPAINWQAAMSADHIRVCLGAILDALPDSQRVCAVLWGEGYPLRSISRKLGLSTTAVNYIIACTLGSITNAVNTLGENGLPLFSMEPIPFFLWLLLSFYQSDQGDALNLGSESSFSSIIKILMPEEASLYDTEEMYDEEPDEEMDEFFEEFEAANKEPVFTPGYEEEMYAESSQEVSEDISESSEEIDLSDFIINNDEKAEEAEDEEPGLPVPPMEIYPADPGAESIFIIPAPEKTDDDSNIESPDSEEAEGESGEAEGESEEAEEKSEVKEEDSCETEDSKEDNADSKEPVIPVGDAFTPVSEAAAEDGEIKKKKSHKGLIITLIIIFIVLCLGAGAFIFYGNYVKNTINKLLGSDFFETTASLPEESTEAETEEITEPETTTEAETTTEPETTTEAETTTEEYTGPEYQVQIYADGEALSMKNVPDGDRLAYIPSEYEVTIFETRDGWGRTEYDGEEGWIWLEWTKVVGRAPVQKPEKDQFLKEPEIRTVYGDGSVTELRLAPGFTSSTFGPVPDGAEVSVEAYAEDPYFGMYAYVSYEGNHGWINADLLS